MDLTAKIEFLNRAIASQRSTLLVQTALALVLVALGLVVVVLGFVFPGSVLPESLKGGQTLGGACVSASGFVPIFTVRRDKIAALRYLLKQYEQQQGKSDAEAVKRLDGYFDQYFAKALGG